MHSNLHFFIIIIYFVLKEIPSAGARSLGAPLSTCRKRAGLFFTEAGAERNKLLPFLRRREACIKVICARCRLIPGFTALIRKRPSTAKRTFYRVPGSPGGRVEKHAPAHERVGRVRWVSPPPNTCKSICLTEIWFAVWNRAWKANGPQFSIALICKVVVFI